MQPKLPTCTPTLRGRSTLLLTILVLAAPVALSGCAPSKYRKDADETAHGLIDQSQREAVGETEPFTIQRPAEALRRKLLGKQALPTASPASYGAHRIEKVDHWPEKGYPAPTEQGGSPVGLVEKGEPVELTLAEALQVAARNSREYQAQKEQVFRTALALDLEIDKFRSTYTGMLESLLSTDQGGPGTAQSGVENTGELGLSKKLESGAELSTRLIVDLAKLLSSSEAESAGVAIDASITVPLLRGAGRHIVAEPMTQAQRDLIYAIWEFERFKRRFAVEVVDSYYSVLRAHDRVRNTRASYESQVASTRRTRALAKRDRKPQKALDQARQRELSVRNQWISAQQNYEDTLDAFKQKLGLPPDAAVTTDRQELKKLHETVGKRLRAAVPKASGGKGGSVPPIGAPVELEKPSKKEGGPYELKEQRAIELALKNRLDLRVARAKVEDKQRKTVVAADALRAGLDLTGTASAGGRRSLGSAGRSDAELRPEEGFYSAGLEVDLPLERTSERNAYRNALIDLQEAVRAYQKTEDEVKADVRSDLRSLLDERETYTIQIVSERVAERRVERTETFLQFGREGVSARDVNEAQTDLLSARNNVTEALIAYRISELEIQRDMGVLRVTEKGLYDELDPSKLES